MDLITYCGVVDLKDLITYCRLVDSIDLIAYCRVVDTGAFLARAKPESRFVELRVFFPHIQSGVLVVRDAPASPIHSLTLTLTHSHSPGFTSPHIPSVYVPALQSQRPPGAGSCHGAGRFLCLRSPPSIQYRALPMYPCIGAVRFLCMRSSL